jgi:amino acid transporter
MHLNRVITNAGASYAWVGQIFHPVLGFFAGWALLAASALFMVSGTIPAATATLTLISPELAEKPHAVIFVAIGWLLAVSAVIVKGIKVTSYTQLAMTLVEVGVLVVIIVAAIIQFGAQPAHAFSWRWFSPAEFTPELFAAGALIALFFFWGWDVTLNLNEETRNAEHAAGRGAVLAMIIVLLLFMSFAAITLLVLSDVEIEQSGTNVVFAIAEKLFPRPWSYNAVIAVMLSSIGTLETTILQFTRTMFAKGRDRVLHPRYAILHSTWRTPWVATGVIAFFGVVLLLLSLFFPTINLLIKDSINAIGFQIAFYYSLTGFACAWHFRKHAFSAAQPFLYFFLWPVASSAFLVFIAIYSIPTFDTVTLAIGIGGIAVGAVPLLLNRLARRRRTASALI